jgi:hypothetical protein
VLQCNILKGTHVGAGLPHVGRQIVGLVRVLRSDDNCLSAVTMVSQVGVVATGQPQAPHSKYGSEK